MHAYIHTHIRRKFGPSGRPSRWMFFEFRPPPLDVDAVIFPISIIGKRLIEMDARASVFVTVA
eukprot:3049006-Heterocapsa_arctica.AAC.1